MATDQGVGGSNPLTHVYCKKKAGQIVLLFFLQRTYGSDSNGFGLHSVPVGAERMSAGHPAPSHARYIVLLFSCNEPTVRIRTGSIYAPLRSVLNGCPPDIQHPLTHVILSCFFLATNLRFVDLHSVPVGAKRRSTGPSAPSHARLLQEEGRKEKEMMIYALFSKLQQSEQQSEKEGWIDADDLERELGVNID